MTLGNDTMHAVDNISETFDQVIERALREKLARQDHEEEIVPTRFISKIKRLSSNVSRKLSFKRMALKPLTWGDASILQSLSKYILKKSVKKDPEFKQKIFAELLADMGIRPTQDTLDNFEQDLKTIEDVEMRSIDQVKAGLRLQDYGFDHERARARLARINTLEAKIRDAKQAHILHNSDLLKATKDASTREAKQTFHVLQGSASTLTFISGILDGAYLRSLTGALITARNKVQYSLLGKAKNSYEISGKEVTNNLMSFSTGLPQFIQGAIDVASNPAGIFLNKDFLPGLCLVLGYGGAATNAKLDEKEKIAAHEARQVEYRQNLQRAINQKFHIGENSFENASAPIASGEKESRIKGFLEVVPQKLIEARAYLQTGTALASGVVSLIDVGTFGMGSAFLVAAGGLQIIGSRFMKKGNEKFSLKPKWREENRRVCFNHEMQQMKKYQGTSTRSVLRYLTPANQEIALKTTRPEFYSVAPLDLSDHDGVTPYERRLEIEAPYDAEAVKARIFEYKVA